MYQRIRQSDRLYEEVVQQIQEMIVSGHLRLHDKLPTEPELAEEFGVSRTVVREAVKTLKEKGLIEVVQGRGTFVTAPTSNMVTGSFGLFLRMEHPSPSELIEARQLLEIEIAGLAAERARQENLDKINSYLAEMESTVEAPEDFHKADTSFHKELSKSAQNIVLETMIEPVLVAMYDTLRTVSQVPGGLHRALDHHRKICERIKAGDREGAREAMRQHLEQVRKDTEMGLSLVGQHPDGDPAEPSDTQR